ncbi:MAG: hypothetical protein ACI4M7_05685 [Succinivibrio sp.]
MGQSRSCSNLWTLLAPMILDSAPIVRNIQFPLSVISTPDGSIVVLIASFPFSTVGIKGVCTPFISSACTKICNTST